MSFAYLAIWLMAGSPGADAILLRQARGACAARLGERPSVEGVRIEAHGRTGVDLPYLRITAQRSGGWMDAYYDAVSEKAAWSRAACLGAQIALLDAETGPLPDGRWNSVVVTSDAAYEPPRDGSETRWKVRTDPTGALDEKASRMVIETMPHEQVHEYQRRSGARAPRWFIEGHAEWVGRRVTSMIAPGQEPPVVRELRLAGKPQPTALRLASWGGVQPKREAILRQVSAEDRRRMEADPSFVPSGPYTFGPGDITSDESNTAARYQASWSIFHDLETRHTARAVRGWVAELTSRKGTVPGTAIVDSARGTFKEELAPRLN